MADDDFVNGWVHDIAARREGRREWGAREIRGRSAHLRRRGDDKEERGVAVFFYVFSRVFVGVVGARQRGGEDDDEEPPVVAVGLRIDTLIVYDDTN